MDSFTNAGFSLYTTFFGHAKDKLLQMVGAPKLALYPILIKETGLVCEGPTTSKLELLVGEASRTNTALYYQEYACHSFMHAGMSCHCFLVEII